MVNVFNINVYGGNINVGVNVYVGINIMVNVNVSVNVVVGVGVIIFVGGGLYYFNMMVLAVIVIMGLNVVGCEEESYEYYEEECMCIIEEW